jgi:apocytochrome f
MKKVGNLYYQPYSRKKKYSSCRSSSWKQYSEMVVPLLRSSYKQKCIILKISYVGGNRGRGQVYPDGSKSNNTVYNSPVSGTITNSKTGR